MGSSWSCFFVHSVFTADETMEASGTAKPASASPITTFFNPPTHPSPPFYTHVANTNIASQAVSARATRLVTLAGQIGRSASGDLATSLSEQVRIALMNVLLCLSAAGATRRDIISIRQYVVGLDPQEKERKRLMRAWLEGREEFADADNEQGGRAFGGSEAKPPNTVLGVQSLAVEGALYEVEVMAAVAVADTTG